MKERGLGLVALRRGAGSRSGETIGLVMGVSNERRRPTLIRHTPSAGHRSVGLTHRIARERRARPTRRLGSAAVGYGFAAAGVVVVVVAAAGVVVVVVALASFVTVGLVTSVAL
jgi:hypothetical protein